MLVTSFCPCLTTYLCLFLVRFAIFDFSDTLRKGQEATVFAAFNFGDTELKDYELTLPGKGKIPPLLNSDWNCFGGRTARPKALRSKTTTGSVKLTLAPYSAQLYRFEPAVEKETKATPHNS